MCTNYEYPYENILNLAIRDLYTNVYTIMFSSQKYIVGYMVPLFP